MTQLRALVAELRDTGDDVGGLGHGARAASPTTVEVGSPTSVRHHRPFHRDDGAWVAAAREGAEPSTLPPRYMQTGPPLDAAARAARLAATEERRAAALQRAAPPIQP